MSNNSRHEQRGGRRGGSAKPDGLRIPPTPSFHRWVLALGLFLLATWFPYHLAAEFAESRLTKISKPAPPLPALYTLGFWFTAIGIAIEVCYGCAAGHAVHQDQQEQFSHLSGRSRFRRGKKSYKYSIVSPEPEAILPSRPAGMRRKRGRYIRPPHWDC